MNCLDEYMSTIKPRIEAAVASAMPMLGEKLAAEIDRQAQERVYSYAATGWAMAKRRGTIGALANLRIAAGQSSVEIENQSVMQGGLANETAMVEEGWSNFRQPGPRPFMDEAMNEYVDSGKGDRDLAEHLRAAGFTVV